MKRQPLGGILRISAIKILALPKLALHSGGFADKKYINATCDNQ